jgi:catechol 2,3-dioxygenase-like lactoylglutathione lyase family enzyme
LSPTGPWRPAAVARLTRTLGLTREAARLIKGLRMLHHIELYVSDLERSISFWTPLMERLGYEAERWSDGMNYLGAEDEPYICLLQAAQEHLAAGFHRKRVGLNHLAFRAKSRQQVDDIRDWMKEAGCTLLYDESYPYATAPDYYAVFCEDPDRIKLEVVAPGDA